ncbi:hypothetical protein TTHERM_000028849 (macronuclear) [Tetrahymena thermophila SB210]|uniref:Kinase domain protein n=1 Tax=Tetrahymena thermophila (strain SB210) TaxID=312017 RepID=W7XIR2_TETTS|nr:hypothetical protein TTHERM_000028849 [Tetrahymena thermophila SB210]EWS74836.1 hypothetical protein TTHERM_000028849 [Tetrahymena thermophila SB210]|eukprot:XP_012652549.1 hypothetical protein TTHERM_000028849 [Tetrahymena thermophila SB210]
MTEIIKSYQKSEFQQQINYLSQIRLSLQTSLIFLNKFDLECLQQFLTINQQITCLNLKFQYQFEICKINKYLAPFKLLPDVDNLKLYLELASINPESILFALDNLTQKDKIKIINFKFQLIQINKFTQYDFFYNHFSQFQKLSCVSIYLKLIDLNNDFLSNFLCMLQECPELQDLSIKMKQNGVKTGADNFFQIARKRNEKLKNLKIILKSLDLPQNFFKVLSENFQYFPNLVQFKLNLDLSYSVTQIMNENDINFFSDSLSLCQELQNLNIKTNYIDLNDQGLTNLSKCFQSLKKLEIIKININSNKINGQGLADLGFQIARINQLKQIKFKINLNQNSDKFNIDKALQLFYQNLKQQTQIQELQLDLQNISSQPNHIIEFAKSLRNFESKLIILNIRFQNNSILDSSIEIVAQGLQNLINLEKLSIYLNLNNISEKGAIKLNNSLSCCSKLKFLSQDLKWGQQNFNSNFICVQSSFQLQEIDLDMRKFSIDTDQVFSFIKKLQNQQELMNISINLMNTEIKLNDFKQILLHFSKYNKLRRLHLELNKGSKLQKEIKSYTKRKLIYLVTFK